MADQGRTTAKIAQGLITDENFFDELVEPKSDNGWTTYDDASGDRPIDGTGTNGSELQVFTGYVNGSTTKIGQLGDILFRKIAADVSGAGFKSKTFRVPRYARGKVLTLSFDHMVQDLQTTVPDGALRVFLYDDTNNVLIEPDRADIKGGVAGHQLSHICNFQTSVDGIEYYILLHWATTNSADQYRIQINNLRVGRQRIATGSVVTDWTQFTPVINNLSQTLASSVGFWRRVGSEMEVNVMFRYNTGTGGTNAVDISMDMPNGYSIDTTKIGHPTLGNLGNWENLSLTTANVEAGTVIPNDSTTVEFHKNESTGNLQDQDITTSDYIVVKFSAPIAGWGAGTVLSSDQGQRVLAANGILSGSGQTINQNTVTPVVFDEISETTGGFTLNGSGEIELHESGWYTFQSNLTIANIGDGEFFEGRLEYEPPGLATVLKDRSFVYSPVAGGDPSVKVDSTFYGEVGGKVSVAVQHNSTFATRTLLGNGASARSTNFSIKKVQGPQTHALPEFVGMKARQNSGQNINAGEVIVWNTKDYDTHNSFDVSTGIFTSPISGYFTIDASVASSLNVVNGSSWELRIRVNGAIVASEIVEFTGSNGVLSSSISVNSTEFLSAKDEVDIFLVESVSGGSVTLTTTSYFNTLKIVKAR